MALYEDVLGAVHAQALPFPLNKTSTATNNAKLLGKEFDLPHGLKAVLVQSDDTISSPGTKVFKYKDTDAYEVELAAANTDRCVGIAHPLLESLTADDYFFLIKPPVGRQITVTVDASGCTAGNTLNPSGTTDGMVEDSTGTTVTAFVTIGVALATVSSGEVRCLVVEPLVGANA